LTLRAKSRIVDPKDPRRVMETTVGIPVQRIIFWNSDPDGGTCLTLSEYGNLWVDLDVSEVEAFMDHISCGNVSTVVGEA
jgi:hypothetical protein